MGSPEKERAVVGTSVSTALSFLRLHVRQSARMWFSKLILKEFPMISGDFRLKSRERFFASSNAPQSGEC